MNAFKRTLILTASEDIQKFLLEKHGVEADMLDIAELINYNIGAFISDGFDDEEFETEYEEEVE